MKRTENDSEGMKRKVAYPSIQGLFYIESAAGRQTGVSCPCSRLNAAKDVARNHKPCELQDPTQTLLG